MLSLSSISKNFGGLQVLQNVSLRVSEGGIVGLIGPNGAGKTTLFNVITGLVTPTEGSIDFLGRQLKGMAPYQITRCGVARTFQNIRLFKEMSVLENVLVAVGQQDQYAAARVLLPYSGFAETDQREKKIAHELLCRLSLLDKADLPAGTLSYGGQRRLEIARALATAPKLLLLDEPAAGMNTLEKQQLMEQVSKLHQSGLSIFLIEHDMHFVMGVCEQVVVMNFGRVIAVGRPEQIRRNPQVIEAYLGQNGDPEIASTSLD